MQELLIATNPDPDSSLGFLLRVPLGDGIVLRTSGTWPRTKALYCYPVPQAEWPDAAAAERIGDQPALRTVRRTPVGSDPARIREWARGNGMDVPDRGRIPAAVQQAWDLAVGQPGTD